MQPIFGWLLFFLFFLFLYWPSQVALVVKNLPANVRDSGLIPGSGGSPEGGNGNPLQYSCLENPVDRGPWWATVHGVSKNWTDADCIWMTFFLFGGV